jgi:glycosyltransferase involved in cell wall biosynthesis
VSRGSGGHEVLTDKENALLVNPCAPHEIATAIEFLMTRPEEMWRIQQNGTEFVKANLSWAKYAERMEEVFKEELQDHA